MNLSRYPHNPLKHHDHPAVAFPFYPHKHTLNSIKLAAVDTYTGTFPYVDFIRLIIGRILLIQGSYLDETVHLVVWHGDIFHTRAFFPHGELQEVVPFLEFGDLRMAGVDENQTRYDRHQPCRLHPVIGLYGVMFRNEIFQTVFFVPSACPPPFLILVGAHDEPADLLFFFHRRKTHTHIAGIIL